MTGRYQRAVDLLELITLLQEGPTGFSIQQIADHFAVSRRTAERMLSALQRRFPELQHELRKGRKYWKFVPTGEGIGAASGETLLADSSPEENAARPLRRTRWLAQSAQPRDALAGTMAEALRAPISTIGLVAKSALDQPSTAIEALERIVVLSERMNQTIERTLKLVRSAELKIEETSALRLLECVVDEIRAEADVLGVEIVTEVSADLPPLQVDRNLLSSAFVDLARNALDAMPQGGRLSISAAVVNHGDAVCVCIDDTGAGVPEGDEEWIFEPFYSTKDEGAGLGLPMVRQVAAAHGGTVKAVSGASGGASFRVEIPVATEPAD